MKLRISNLGVIESMEIDMSKPFILFAGDNGTGKTYATTFLYTLIVDFGLIAYSQKNNLEDKELPISRRLVTGISGKLNADDLYDFFSGYLKKHQKLLPIATNLNIRTNSFKCEIVTTREEWSEELRNKSIVWFNYIEKKANSYDYKLRWIVNEKDKSFLQSNLLTSLFFDGIFGAQIFAAERSGIYTFCKELSVGRLRNPESRIDIRYPKPIADGLADAVDVVNRKKYGFGYNEFANEIERIYYPIDSRRITR